MTFKNLFSNNELPSDQATANVVDNHLILSIPNACDPIVWRMELKKTGAAAFEIKQGKNEKFNLIVRPTKSTTETIASFDDKEDAIDTLMIASQALQSTETAEATSDEKTTATKPKAAKKAKTTANTVNSNDNNGGRTWVFAIFGTALIIGLFIYLSNIMPRDVVLNDLNTAAAVGGSPQNTTGVPVSADDFLNGF